MSGRSLSKKCLSASRLRRVCDRDEDIAVNVMGQRHVIHDAAPAIDPQDVELGGGDRAMELVLSEDAHRLIGLRRGRCGGRTGHRWTEGKIGFAPCGRSRGDLPAIVGDVTSAASPRFVAWFAEQLAAWVTSNLSKVGPLVSQIDGQHIGNGLALVGAVGIDADGHKHLLGLIEGATENAAVVPASVIRLSAGSI